MRRWISGIEPPHELLASNGTQIFELECREQPARLLQLIHSYATDAQIRAQFQSLRALVSKEGPVLFLGMGASFCSSISGSVLLQSKGRSSFSVDAGEWLYYGVPTWHSAPLSILLTTSGESAELVRLMKEGKEQALALICNNSASQCWELSDKRLPILAGPEYGNATKSYTNAAAASIILASELLDISWQQDAESIVSSFSKCLDNALACRSDLEAFCRGAANIEIIGRGPAYGAAFMGALCIRETAGLRAAAHTGAGFRHGPNLDVDASHVAVIFALGCVADLGIKLAAECNRRGGKVILVSNREMHRTDILYPVQLCAVPEAWEGLTSIVVPQALALAMIERSGCRLPPRFEYGVMQE